METNQTTAAQRLGIVLNWVQAICLVSGLTGAVGSLTVFVFDSSDDWLAIALASAAFGVGGAILIAAISFIIASEFRILPATHRGYVKVSLMGFPLLAILMAVGFNADFSSSTKSTGKVVYLDPEPEPEPELWFDETPLGLGRFGLTNKETGAYMIVDTDPTLKSDGGPENIFVTVLDGWLVATARWDIKCEPKLELAVGITCEHSGEHAYATLRVSKPEWDKYSGNLYWEMDSAGYRVDERLTSYPLDTARQVDASLSAKGVGRPPARNAEHVIPLVRGY